MFNDIKTHLSLLFHSPKDYIYSVRYSDREPIRINPYDPNLRVVAQKLTNRIKKFCPEVQLYLIGSVGLQIEGRGDIDLYATVNPDLYKETKNRLSIILGTPNKVRRDFCEWKIIFENTSAELILTNPLNKRFRTQIRLFNILKSNQTYLAEYRYLKRKLNGCSHKQYALERMEFFNRILK